MTMGDRVAVMRKGELQQVAPPEELYDHPVNLFVAGFIGSPAMNMLEAQLERQNGHLLVKAGDQALALDSHVLEARPRLAEYEGKEVVVGIRPEALEDARLSDGVPPERRLHGKVELREGLGSEIVVHLAVRARPAITEDVRELAEDIGEELPVGDTEEGETTIVARFDPDSPVREGETAEVAVDTRALHFFDPETGLGIYDHQAKGEA
jgi:multiple sugar transport system ATP-binding protein